jgi:hypothetical protein
MTNTNRRTFLKASALAAGFAALRGAAAEAPAPQKPQYHLFSRSFAEMGFDRLCETAAAAGYSGIEWAVRPARGHILPENVRRDLPLAHRIPLRYREVNGFSHKEHKVHKEKVGLCRLCLRGERV